jgi:hypothetical protein
MLLRAFSCRGVRQHAFRIGKTADILPTTLPTTPDDTDATDDDDANENGQRHWSRRGTVRQSVRRNPTGDLSDSELRDSGG